jgi:uncharacterized membrane protein YoaK (UPF0700 family)
MKKIILLLAILAIGITTANAQKKNKISTAKTIVHGQIPQLGTQLRRCLRKKDMK